MVANTWHANGRAGVVVYALWDLATETVIDEGEDPARILAAIEECRTAFTPEIMPVFGLTEYHPALQTHSSISGEDAVVDHLRKRMASRQRREGARNT